MFIRYFSHRSHSLLVMTQVRVYCNSDVCMILMAEAIASYLDLLKSNLLTCDDACKRIWCNKLMCDSLSPFWVILLTLDSWKPLSYQGTEYLLSFLFTQALSNAKLFCPVVMGSPQETVGLERLLAHFNLLVPWFYIFQFCMVGAKDNIIKGNFKIGQKINIKDGFETSQEDKSGII